MSNVKLICQSGCSFVGVEKVKWSYAVMLVKRKIKLSDGGGNFAVSMQEIWDITKENFLLLPLLDFD